MKRVLTLCLALAGLCFGTPTRAADMNVTLPIVTAKPGDTVFVLLHVNPSPDIFIDTKSLEFRLKLGSSVVQETKVMPEGFLWIWGTPYVNAGPDSVLAAAAGPQDMGTTSTHMATIRIIIKPTATIPTDLPITFTKLMFNEGNPSLSFTPGILKVRSIASGVGDELSGALALSAPWPNPAYRQARIAYRSNDEARLDLFTLDGRRVRSEAVRAGQGDVLWSLNDGDGRRLTAGLYFVRLSAGALTRVERLVVMP